MIVIPECLYRGSSLFSRLESGFPIRSASGMTVLGFCKRLKMILKICLNPFNPPFPCSIDFDFFLVGSGSAGLGSNIRSIALHLTSSYHPSSADFSSPVAQLFVPSLQVWHCRCAGCDPVPRHPSAAIRNQSDSLRIPQPCRPV